jgi:hypothetical protein
MAAGSDLAQKGAEDVARRADQLRVRLSRPESGGWALDGLPFSLAELGYPNLHDPEAPNRVDALSLREADHFLRLCEERLRDRLPSARERPRGSFLG